jgi:hypothetical protein
MTFQESDILSKLRRIEEKQKSLMVETGKIVDENRLLRNPLSAPNTPSRKPPSQKSTPSQTTGVRSVNLTLATKPAPKKTVTPKKKAAVDDSLAELMALRAMTEDSDDEV